MDFNIKSCTCTFTWTNFDMQPGMTCHKYKQSLNCISRVNSNCIRYGIQQLKHLKFMTLTPFSASLHCSFPVASPAFQQLQQRMWHWKGFKPGFFTETGGKWWELEEISQEGPWQASANLWLAHVSPCRCQSHIVTIHLSGWGRQEVAMRISPPMKTSHFGTKVSNLEWGSTGHPKPQNDRNTNH